MMAGMAIRVSDFTDIPGPRYESEGDFSGEEFRKKHLEAAFARAVAEDQILEVHLDGVRYGYPASFLEESFGGLTRLWSKKSSSPRLTEEDVWKRLKIVSKDRPSLPDTVQRYVLEANQVTPRPPRPRRP